MSLSFAPASATSIPLFVLESGSVEAFLAEQPDRVRQWVTTLGFSGALGSALVIPSEDGCIAMALAGYGTDEQRRRGRFHLAGAAAKLPAGAYHIESGVASDQLAVEALGWLLQGYRFDRYKAAPAQKARLVAPNGIDARRVEIIAAGEKLARDLINTPSSDMGPDALETAAQDLADQHGAEMRVVVGDDLLAQNFPMIHAVGRASDEAPRLLDISWGKTGPKLTLVGKGVCFDTGGLNIKPGSSMGLMKKDMGGAANVLGLAHMIMALGLEVQLRVLIPAVENAIDGSAFRPQDVLSARNGMTVEINNTDAEGRLVLADALVFGAEDAPDLMISMATLTGAARVAVGPDLAPFYADDGFANAIGRSAEACADPVWRMPFHAPYERMIEPEIADLDNAPSGGFAGSITAALFLRRFAGDTRYAHFDIYGWQPTALPGRPKGGVGQGIRALLDGLPGILKG